MSSYLGVLEKLEKEKSFGDTKLCFLRVIFLQNFSYFYQEKQDL